MKLLLDEIGNPEKKLSVIHVAGTNGKGSVCNMIGSILTECKYNVGVYNSPYIISYRETIRINGSMVSEALFVQSANKIIEARESLRKTQQLTITNFECITAIALDIFATVGVNYAVIEVGLGGRDDATNVFDAPLCSVITSISYDHMQLLGNSIEQIAMAKAGIIKTKSPVILSPNVSTVTEVIMAEALRLDAPLYCIGDDISWKIHQMTKDHMIFSIKTPFFAYEHLTSSLLGEHQIENILTALTVLYVISPKLKAPVSLSAVRNGLSSVSWPCRCEYVREPMKIFLDGAHNTQGIESLIKVLKTVDNSGRITLLFGILRDKDASTILDLLSKVSDTIFLTQPISERAESLEVLDLLAQPLFSHIEKETDPIKALYLANEYAKKTNTLLCCVGSLHLAIPIRYYVVEGLELQGTL